MSPPLTLESFNRFHYRRNRAKALQARGARARRAADRAAALLESNEHPVARWLLALARELELPWDRAWELADPSGPQPWSELEERWDRARPFVFKLERLEDPVRAAAFLRTVRVPE